MRLFAPPPLSTDAFLLRAKDCLSEKILEDLERLLFFRTLNRLSRNNTGEHIWMDAENMREASPHRVRYHYWLWLNKTALSPFLRRFAADALRLWHLVGRTIAPYHDETPLIVKEFLHDSQLDAIYEARLATQFANDFADHNPLPFEHSIARNLLAIVEHHKSSDMFSCDQVFAYFIELILCERFVSFDQAKGHAILNQIVSGLGE